MISLNLNTNNPINRFMTRDLIVRGFDDKIHANLGKIATQRGVSINSIVKDAVDNWLKHQYEVPRKHHLVIYSDDESMIGLLKTMDRLANESDLFRCYCGPPQSPETELLSKLKWFNGTPLPYYFKNELQRKRFSGTRNEKDIAKYCRKTITNFTNGTKNRQICCMDFLINDIIKQSLKEAMIVERLYDNNRLSGLMYCNYKAQNFANSDVKSIVELFQMHDQVFILENTQVYKLHLTKENIHKMILS